MQIELWANWKAEKVGSCHINGLHGEVGGINIIIHVSLSTYRLIYRLTADIAQHTAPAGIGNFLSS